MTTKDLDGSDPIFSMTGVCAAVATEVLLSIASELNLWSGNGLSEYISIHCSGDDIDRIMVICFASNLL
jgi:hypothetical protein